MTRLIAPITCIMAACVTMQAIAQEGENDLSTSVYVYKTIGVAKHALSDRNWTEA